MEAKDKERIEGSVERIRGVIASLLLARFVLKGSSFGEIACREVDASIDELINLQVTLLDVLETKL